MTKLFDQETAASFASRFPGARESGLLAEVHKGSLPAVSRLARAAGLEAARLVSAAAQYDPQDPEGVTVLGERLSRGGTIRTRARACPCCLKEDIVSGGPSEMHGRASWIIRSFLTCPDHKVMIITPPGGGALSDFHQSWSSHTKAVFSGELNRPGAEDPSFERYVVDRFSGKRSGLWIDGLRLDVIGEISKMIGFSMNHGKTARFENHTALDLSRALETGFKVIEAGPDGLRLFFDRLRKSEGSAQDLPQARYGEIFDYLRRGPGSNPGFEPIKAVFRQHLLDTWPFGAGDVVLDDTAKERRFHSLMTAATEYSLHPVRLKKILLDAGLIGEAEKGNDQIIPVGVIDRLLSVETEAMTYPEVHGYLDIGRSQLEALADSGVLAPQPPRPGTRPRFARADVENFRARLESYPEISPKEADAYPTIMKAQQRLKCGAARIVSEIISGMPEGVFRVSGAPAYSSIRVDLEIMRARLNPSETPEP